MADEPVSHSPPALTEPANHSMAIDEKLTTVDILICMLMPLVGGIVGIVRLIQMKPSGGKMIGLSVVSGFAWTFLLQLLSEVAAD